jgi:hypothetical protein
LSIAASFFPGSPGGVNAGIHPTGWPGEFKSHGTKENILLMREEDVLAVFE